MRDVQQILAERTARVTAAVDLLAHDRIPVVGWALFFPVHFSKKYTIQEAFYKIDVAAECFNEFFSEWNEWDAFSATLQSFAPMLDATGSRRYSIPGRDIPANAEFQFPDLSLMSAEEYPAFIADPIRFQLEVIIPRLCDRISSSDPYERMKALTKAAMFYVESVVKAQRYAPTWINEYGIPPVFQGAAIFVPTDWIADKLRGFRQGMLDIKARPDELEAACEAMLPFMLDACLPQVPIGSGFPLLFNPQHISPFMSPKDYDRVYWPTFKKMVDRSVERGFKVWAFLENNQEQHLERLQDLPKGQVVVHVESTDLAKAKKVLGGKVCLAGGMFSRLLVRGTPDDVRDQATSVLKLFEDEPGFIMANDAALPTNTKPENLHAWLDTVKKYGSLGGAAPVATGAATTSNGVGAKGKEGTGERGFSGSYSPSSWETVKAEFGRIQGDEGVVRDSWEALEKLLPGFISWIIR